MSIRFGIDLGTTYSTISYYDEPNRRVDAIDLENEDGARTLPSVVFFPQGGDAIVGGTAKRMAKMDESRVVRGSKRSMGTDYKTDPIDGKTYTPTEIATIILKTLAADAPRIVGEEVKDVVITVPAYFGDGERAATREAGEQAGLNVLDLLPEPHAAALAYAIDMAEDINDRNILVYDLGGGTFDVTLIRATSDGDAERSLTITTIAKDGDRELGGMDWDNALCAAVAEKVDDEFDVDPRDDPKDKEILTFNAEEAKRQLSKAPMVSVVADREHHEVSITVGEFEDATRDLLDRTKEMITTVLDEVEKNHQLSKDKIDVMIAGGSTRMPMVKSLLTAIFGTPPLEHHNLDLLVSRGAAYWAHILDGRSITVPVPDDETEGGIKEVELRVEPGGLVDTSPYEVGLETRPPGQDPKFSVILPAGLKYGETIKREYQTAAEGMTEIPINLFRYDGTSDPNERPDISACKELAKFTISGLPAGRPEGQIVRVELNYDSSGIIRGSAFDVSSQSKVEIKIERP